MNADRPSTTSLWAKACLNREECAGGRWHRCQPDQDHQLRQRETVLHREQRSLLAAEPARSLRLHEVIRVGDAARRPLPLRRRDDAEVCQNEPYFAGPDNRTTTEEGVWRIRTIMYAPAYPGSEFPGSYSAFSARQSALVGQSQHRINLSASLCKQVICSIRELL
jgi:hypothetical protein